MAWVLPEGAVLLKGGATQPVVGESYCQQALDALCGGRCGTGHELMVLAAVVREPDNRFDPNAVRVEVARWKVGYIPLGDAAAWAELLEGLGGAAFCRASIRGGWDRDGDVGSYGISLSVAHPVSEAVPKQRTHPGGWADDPTGRFVLRWKPFVRGERWSEWVWDGHRVIHDPVTSRPLG